MLNFDYDKIEENELLKTKKSVKLSFLDYGLIHASIFIIGTSR